MDAFTRLAVMNLLGELLTGQKDTYEVERAFRTIISDEKVRSYEVGLKDGRYGLGAAAAQRCCNKPAGALCVHDFK